MTWFSTILQKVKPKVAATSPTPVAAAPTGINWSDPKAKISKYFTVHEATFLPSWNTHHVPSDEEKANIVAMALAMDQVRDLLGPISVNVWIRPKKANCPGFDLSTIKVTDPDKKKALAALDYNAFIKGAKASAHIIGSAVDWHVANMTCDAARARLLPKLGELGLCMEDLPGSNWVHTDRMPPRGGKTRFFKP